MGPASLGCTTLFEELWRSLRCSVTPLEVPYSHGLSGNTGGGKLKHKKGRVTVKIRLKRPVDTDYFLMKQSFCIIHSFQDCDEQE